MGRRSRGPRTSGPAGRPTSGLPTPTRKQPHQSTRSPGLSRARGPPLEAALAGAEATVVDLPGAGSGLRPGGLLMPPANEFADLLERIRLGDRGALGELLGKYEPALRRFARSH